MSHLGNAGSYLTQTLLGFALYVILLRFWMQWVRASFRNPFGQFIIAASNPIIIPLRRVLPSIGVIDTATVILAFVIALAKVFLLLTLLRYSASWLGIALFSLGEVIRCSINIFFAAILIQMIASWVESIRYHPIVSMARSISEPLLAPARRVIPPIAGLDLSPMAIILLLQVTLKLVVAPLQNLSVVLT